MMLSAAERAAIARRLLASVNLEWFIDAHHLPDPKAWARYETLSSGERVVAALAFAIIDYSGPAENVKLDRLLLLDDMRLRAVALALLQLTGEDIKAVR